MALQLQMYSENPGFMFGSQENSCGFNESSFNLLQKQKQQYLYLLQQMQNQQLMNQNQCFGNGFQVCSTNVANNFSNNQSSSMPYSQSLDLEALMENERREIDQYIRQQNEKLRWVLQEQRKQQLSLSLKKIESKATTLLRQKDLEMAEAAKRGTELEQFLRKLEFEKQEWQRVAQENEAMVVSLNNTLEEMREKACCSNSDSNNGAEEDAESFFWNGTNREEGEDEEEKDETTTERKQRTMMTTMVCRSCHYRDSCVLFLPCRHLCCCKDCEAFLDSCPVCGTIKKSCLEALI